jgi:hypothetical protein
LYPTFYCSCNPYCDREQKGGAKINVNIFLAEGGFFHDGNKTKILILLSKESPKGLFLPKFSHNNSLKQFRKIL